jgi:hypothetical protein
MAHLPSRLPDGSPHRLDILEGVPKLRHLSIKRHVCQEGQLGMMRVTLDAIALMSILDMLSRANLLVPQNRRQRGIINLLGIIDHLHRSAHTSAMTCPTLLSNLPSYSLMTEFNRSIFCRFFLSISACYIVLFIMNRGEIRSLSFS